MGDNPLDLLSDDKDVACLIHLKKYNKRSDNYQWN